ncbi:MAG: MotA/TolQ/ExbB proton channel family protein [bacterium]
MNKAIAKITVYIRGSIFLFFAILATTVSAQSSYEITISDISYLKVKKNWLFIPKEVDLRLHWKIEEKSIRNGVEKVIQHDADELPLTFQVYLFEWDGETGPIVRKVAGVNYADFLNKPVGKKFVFKVRAYSANAMLVAESAPATIVVGKGNKRQYTVLAGKNWTYYLNPGRWQLMILGKSEIYDKSTELGKVAFLFLSISTVLSFLVLIFYSSRTLYLGNIFPFRRTKRNFFWSLSLSCDKTYENRLTNKFKFILKAWETIAIKSRMVADRATKNIPQGLSATEKMASVDVACLEYWTNDGDKAIGTIEDIIAYPFVNGEHNGSKKPDDLLTELVIKIEDSFQDLITKNGNGEHTNGSLIDMSKIIDEIYEPVIKDDKLLARIRKWILKKGIFDLRKGLDPFPTSKIIRAGLEIHRMNGYRWLKPSEEVKSAFENRASIEIENLRRKSKIEWFWNYGALAPLVGLFGTVTGITYAFQQLSNTTARPDFVNTIQQLSSGIFEALWTTIFGLANGIIFILVYYYFKHKLEWIYAKWEEVYISITEKL